MKVELADQFEVTTAPADTFAFLTDPQRFAPLLPYFKELKDVQPGAFTVGLEVGIPQLRGRVDVDVKLVESVAPERATYKSSGRHALGMVDSELCFQRGAERHRFNGALAERERRQRHAGLARTGDSDSARQASDQGCL